MCNDGYHDESYNEQMEAQHGSPDNAPDGIPARDVDAALRRIEEELERLPYRFGLNAFLEINHAIAQERERLGLPAETEVKA